MGKGLTFLWVFEFFRLFYLKNYSCKFCIFYSHSVAHKLRLYSSIKNKICFKAFMVQYWRYSSLQIMIIFFSVDDPKFFIFHNGNLFKLIRVGVKCSNIHTYFLIFNFF